MTREYHNNLKLIYPEYGFKILRGYKFTDLRGRDCIMILRVKVGKPRTGILRKFCLDILEHKDAISFVNPSTNAMINFLHKYKFTLVVLSKNMSAGILSKHDRDNLK